MGSPVPPFLFPVGDPVVFFPGSDLLAVSLVLATFHLALPFATCCSISFLGASWVDQTRWSLVQEILVIFGHGQGSGWQQEVVLGPDLSLPPLGSLISATVRVHLGAMGGCIRLLGLPDLSPMSLAVPFLLSTDLVEVGSSHASIVFSHLSK